MPKAELYEPRNDFSGGLNISGASDAMNPNELLQCGNARVEQFGGIMRRGGSKILVPNAPDTDTPAPLTGIYQWTPPGFATPQLVTISDGIFYWSNTPYLTWNKLGGAIPEFHLIGPQDFVQFRASSVGAPVELFIAGNTLHKWTGSAKSNTGQPANVIRSFGTRMFAASGTGTNSKRLYWSAIGDATDWTPGGAAGAGSSLIDIAGGDGVFGLECIGDSLLIGTNETIARFTGTGDDVQILQSSAGVSTEIGPASVGNMLRAGQVVFVRSERGIYVANSGGVLSVGDKVVNPLQAALRMSNQIADFDTTTGIWTPICGHNPRRSEVWVAYAPLGTAGATRLDSKRTNCLVYNYKLQCWYGPFVYPFSISSLGVYEDADGIESIMAGCCDGLVRLLDDSTFPLRDDDVSDFDSIVQFAPFGLPAGPSKRKALKSVYLQVIGEYTFSVTVTGELGETDTGTLIV